MEFNDLPHFHEIEERFNRAIISNDVQEIKKCISDDWVLIDTQGGIVTGETFLRAVETGALSHSSMTIDVKRVRVYGQVAIITGRGQNSAIWKGQAIESDEWITDVYQKNRDGWVCVLTHLTPVKQQAQK